MNGFVKNPRRILRLHHQAKDYGCLPSQILCLTDELAAYSLNSAVHLFASAYENAVSEAQSKAKDDAAFKRKKVLLDHKWLGIDDKD